MLWIFSLCTLMGSGILFMLFRRDYRRAGRVHTLVTTLDWSGVPPAASSNARHQTTERVEKALRIWTDQYAESEPPVTSAMYGAAEPDAPEPETLPSQPEAASSFVQPIIPEAAPEPAPSAEEAKTEEPTAEATDEATFTFPARDHYEVLQICPDADMDAIHRVYRIMASRFHPDNQVTGNVERFLQLTQAYKVLSDPASRAQYDSTIGLAPAGALPIFGMKVFLDGVEGENNRRLGVLSLLYHRRRLNESQPGVSLLELERRMAFPREYLHFTLWYLRAKGYISVMEDNSDYALTATGVDYVEANASTNPVIRELLTAGSGNGAGTGEVQKVPKPNRRRRDGERNRQYRGQRRIGSRGMAAGSV